MTAAAPSTTTRPAPTPSLIVASVGALARQGQRVFDVGMVLAAALLVYAGARPWATLSAP